jgi:hypothetical protein
VLVYAAALAACVAAAIYLGTRTEKPTPEPKPNVQPVIAELPPDQPRLNDQVGEAGSALAALVSRTADQAVDQGKILVPEKIAAPAPMKVDTLLEKPAQSIRDAGQGVTAGLEPVTAEARRAVTLFMRDIPPMGQSLQ